MNVICFFFLFRAAARKREPTDVSNFLRLTAFHPPADLRRIPAGGQFQARVMETVSCSSVSLGFAGRVGEAGPLLQLCAGRPQENG